VACLVDNDAKLALDPSNPFLIQTKPHGHGDVHTLLHSSGLLPKWQQEGRMWVLFFQDTNGLLFKVCSCLIVFLSFITSKYQVGITYLPQMMDSDEFCDDRESHQPWESACCEI
jgi:hypothetical protein